jgi:hypothetical protein
MGLIEYSFAIETWNFFSLCECVLFLLKMRLLVNRLLFLNTASQVSLFPLPVSCPWFDFDSEEIWIYIFYISYFCSESCNFIFIFILNIHSRIFLALIFYLGAFSLQYWWYSWMNLVKQSSGNSHLPFSCMNIFT